MSSHAPFVMVGFTIDDGMMLPRPSKTKLRPFHRDGVVVVAILSLFPITLPVTEGAIVSLLGA